MDIKLCKDGMTPDEIKDVAYFERNMLALTLAILLNESKTTTEMISISGWFYDIDNNWDGFKRVISIDDGSICFHIPDEFDTGALPQIEPNWDGHTTEEKWNRLIEFCRCK